MNQSQKTNTCNTSANEAKDKGKHEKKTQPLTSDKLGPFFFLYFKNELVFYLIFYKVPKYLCDIILYAFPQKLKRYPENMAQFSARNDCFITFYLIKLLCSQSKTNGRSYNCKS